MKSILSKLILTLGTKLASVLIHAADSLKETVKYLLYCKKEKEKKENVKEVKEYNEKVEDAVNNGTVEDLLNL